MLKILAKKFTITIYITNAINAINIFVPTINQLASDILFSIMLYKYIPPAKNNKEQTAKIIFLIVIIPLN